MRISKTKDIVTKVLFVIMVFALCSCETVYSKKS